MREKKKLIAPDIFADQHQISRHGLAKELGNKNILLRIDFAAEDSQLQLRDKERWEEEWISRKVGRNLLLAWDGLMEKPSLTRASQADLVFCGQHQVACLAVVSACNALTVNGQETVAVMQWAQRPCHLVDIFQVSGHDQRVVLQSTSQSKAPAVVLVAAENDSLHAVVEVRGHRSQTVESRGRSSHVRRLERGL